MSIKSRHPSTVQTAPLSSRDFGPLFRAAQKLAAHRGLDVEDVLEAAPAAWGTKKAAGGKRPGAGRPGKDWSRLTTFEDAGGQVPGLSFKQLALAMVIRQAASRSDLSKRQAFDLLTDGTSAQRNPEQQATLYATYGHRMSREARVRAEDIKAREAATAAAMETG